MTHERNVPGDVCEFGRNQKTCWLNISEDRAHGWKKS